MRAIIVRFAACAVALGTASLLFPQAINTGGILPGSIMLTILYTLLRPLLLVFILPVNLHVFGLLTPLADALFVLWTSAWVSDISMDYWQAAGAALMISVAYFPYSLYTQKRLTCPNNA